MGKSKSASWQRLDNAAKLFPPTSNRRDTKVFRFACRLNEEVNPATLQLALEKTMVAFPLYASIIRKGFFWYYFESSTIKPIVKLENTPPCSALYNENTKNLLFQVSYYNKNINLEIYHALTDGAGALQFLRTLVLNYIILEHPEAFKENIPTIDYDASLAQKQDDSFKKHFIGGKTTKKVTLGKAYKLKGETHEHNLLQVINGVLPVKDVLKESKKHDTTLTIFLSALLIYSIGKELSVADKKNPVVVSVPVNLRQYFQSASARNFFSVINVPYKFSEEETKFEDIINSLNIFFEKELTTEKFRLRLSKLVALEHNYATRLLPLVFKKPTLKFAHYLTNREVTTSLSNIGKISMPSDIEDYIDIFDVYVSTAKTQICLCSFKDKLSINFTSPFINTEVQKNFFRELSSRGIPVTITTNISDN